MISPASSYRSLNATDPRSPRPAALPFKKTLSLSGASGLRTSRSSRLSRAFVAALWLLSVTAAFALDLALDYTKTGTGFGGTVPTLSYNNGFVMVKATWAPPSGATSVEYEAWIESTTTDWGSANTLQSVSGGTNAWRQRIYLPYFGDEARDNCTVKMSFRHRLPGLLEWRIGDEAARAALPAQLPLSPGTYPFTFCVSQTVDGGPPVVGRTDFNLTINGTVPAFFISGVSPHQVIQRKTETTGDLSFCVETPGVTTPRTFTAAVVSTGTEATIASDTFTKTSAHQLFNFSNLPVGGEYRLQVTMDGATQTVEPLSIGDLWVIGGQSNAVGGLSGNAASYGRTAMPNVKALSPTYGTLEWKKATDGLFEATSMSAWVTAAQDFYSETGVPVGLMGFARGSRSMDYFMDQNHVDLPFHKELIERDGVGAARFFWYQGESDAFSEDKWSVYEDKLNALAAAVRRHAQNPSMTLGVVQLSKYAYTSNDTFAELREAQRHYVLTDSNSALYSTLPYTVSSGDKIHLVGSSQAELGRQIGRHMIAVEQGEPFGSPGPVPVSAEFDSNDPLRIIVAFDSLTPLVGGANLNEWYVTDDVRRGFGAAGGFVSLTSVTVDAVNREVRLQLGAAPAGQVQVSYGYRSDLGGTLANEDGHPAQGFVKLPVAPLNALAPSITSAAAATGTVGVAFSYQTTATNNPTSYSATGLPSGLSFDSSTGLIFGTPAASGSSDILLSATNAEGTGIKTLTLAISSSAQDDLVGFWTMDENSGTTVANSSGSANYGSFLGAPGPAWTSDAKPPGGSALEFNGTTALVTCGNGSSLNMSGAMTLMGWFKHSSSGGSGISGIDKSGAYRVVAVEANAASSKWQFFIVGAGGAAPTLQTPTAYTNDEWHHVAGTFDGSKLVLYVDGQQSAASNWTGTIVSSGNSLLFGRRDSTAYFKGFIDQVKLYNRALTAGEIAAEYSSTRSMTFDSWRTGKFTAAERGNLLISGDLADADGDGLVNLQEYAFGCEPKVAEFTALVDSTTATNVADDLDYLAVSYKRRKGPTDISYIPEISGDLVTWNTDPAGWEQILVTDDGNGATETVTLQVKPALSLQLRNFFRVRVTRP